MQKQQLRVSADDNDQELTATFLDVTSQVLKVTVPRLSEIHEFHLKYEHKLTYILHIKDMCNM